MKSRADLTTVPGFADLDVDTDGNPIVWENHYTCQGCSSEQVDWSDTWSCQCNDRCPGCDTVIEPHESTWIGPESEVLKALWEALAEVGSQEASPLKDRARRPSLTLLEIAAIYGLMLQDDRLKDSELAGKFAKLIQEELNPARRELVAAYHAAAVTEDGVIEIDPDAEISEGTDPGAYVMVWQWVSAKDAGVEVEEYDEDDLLNSIADERANDPTTLTKLEEL